MIETTDDLHRVREAVAGRLDPAELTGEERRYYYDLLDGALATPNAAEVAAMGELATVAGAVGYDSADRLVRTLPGGGVAVIEAGAPS